MILAALLLAAVGGYLLGSVPFGLVLTRWAGLGDIRRIGSGNIGATNVLRTGNKPLALAVLLLDSGKGALAVGLAAALTPPESARYLPLIAGAAALLGHLYPVWLGFKGGKGVATTLGTLLAASFWVGLAACATWALVAFALRYSSLAALVAIGLSPVGAWLLAGWPEVAFTLPVALIVFWKHRANIKRLIAGTEPKIGSKSKAVAADPETAHKMPPPA